MTSSVTCWGNAQSSKYKALLIHGLTSTGNAWWRTASNLVKSDVFCVAPDLLNHGFGKIDLENTKFTDFAQDIFANCYLGLDMEFDYLIGHSLGGPIACALFEILLKRGFKLPHRILLLDPVMHLDGDDYSGIIQSQMAELKIPAREWLRKNPEWHPVDGQIKELGARLIHPDAIEAIFKEKMPDAIKYLPKSLPENAECDCIMLSVDDDPIFTQRIAKEITLSHQWIRTATMRNVNHGGILRAKPDLIAKLLLDGDISHTGDFE